jgi:hypothetical protein
MNLFSGRRTFFHHLRTILHVPYAAWKRGKSKWGPRLLSDRFRRHVFFCHGTWQTCKLFSLLCLTRLFHTAATVCHLVWPIYDIWQSNPLQIATDVFSLQCVRGVPKTTYQKCTRIYLGENCLIWIYPKKWVIYSEWSGCGRWHQSR